jgi:diacylglycerol kinase family enzyme
MSVESNASVKRVPVERILVVDNPYSKNGPRGRKQLDELLDFSGLPFDTIETDYDPLVTADRLNGTLEPTDLLYVIGGDGTVNAALKPLVEHGGLLLPTRSGNANDLATSLNGRDKPWEVFSSHLNSNGHDVNAYPLVVSVEDTSRYSINYASVGYGALASNYLNDPWPSEKARRLYDALPRRAKNMARFPRDGYMLLKAASDAGLFEYTPVGNETEETILVSDVTFVHSPRMAKLGRFEMNQTDPDFFASVLKKAGALAMTGQFIKMMSARMKGKHLLTAAFQVHSPNGKQLYCQVDGEAFKLAESADIRVGLSQRPVRVLSTRLSESRLPPPTSHW